MRLWHKDLIPVLPKNQLLGQWRECCLIAKSIAENGNPNHLLVNKIMDYPLDHFHYYASMISDEMEYRGYKCDFNRFYKYIPLTENHCTYNELFKDWHNNRYLLQCYLNLQEKYDCGGIDHEDWYQIMKLVYKYICQ